MKITDDNIGKVMSVIIVILITFSVYLSIKGLSFEDKIPLLNPFFGFALFIVFGFILPLAWKLPNKMRNHLRYILILASVAIIVGLFLNSSFFDIISSQDRKESFFGEFTVASIVLLLYFPLLITLFFRAWYPLSLLVLGVTNFFGFLLYCILPHGTIMLLAGLILYLTNSIVSRDISIFPKLIDSLLGMLPSILAGIIQHIVYLGYVVLLFLLGLIALAEKEKGGFLTLNKHIMDKLNQITLLDIKVLISLHLISVVLSIIVSIDSLPYPLFGIWGEGLRWISL